MGYFFLSKSATSTALDGSEILLLFFGLILTIGALGEYKKFPRVLRASHATFELLVVIGIAGELFADGGVFVFSRHLQTISDREFAELNKEAGAARETASGADERSKKLESSNKQLGIDLEAEKQKTARFQREADAAQLALQKQAGVLRTQLRTQQSRGTLLMEPESQKRFAKLNSFRGQAIEIGQCGRQDNEVSLFVIDLMVMLGAEGWKVNPWNPFFPCTTGMQMIVRNNAPASTRAAAAALIEVMDDIGLTPKGSKVTLGLTPKTNNPSENFPDPPSDDAVLLIVQLHP